MAELGKHGRPGHGADYLVLAIIREAQRDLVDGPMDQEGKRHRLYCETLSAWFFLSSWYAHLRDSASVAHGPLPRYPMGVEKKLDEFASAWK